MLKKFIFLKITTIIMITITINRFFIMTKKNILMNRLIRTFLLFYSHLIRQFLITKFFNNILSHSSKHFLSSMNWSTRTFLLFQFSFLIKSTTKLFRFITSTIILQSISINLFYSIFSKTLINRFFVKTWLFWSITSTIIL